MRQRRPTQLDVVPYKRGCRASLAPPTPTHPHYTRSSCIRDHCHPRQAPPGRLRDHCHPLLHSPSRSPPLQHQYFERSSKMDQGGREDRGDVQDRYFPDLPLRILMGKPQVRLESDWTFDLRLLGRGSSCQGRVRCEGLVVDLELMFVRSFLTGER